MDNIFPKFIIETDDELGDCLILSKVTYHNQIAIDITKVKGGGWFRYDPKNNSFVFFGKSEQFGKAEFNLIKECVNKDRVFSDPYLCRPLRKLFYYETESGELIPLNDEKSKVV